MSQRAADRAGLSRLEFLGQKTGAAIFQPPLYRLVFRPHRIKFSLRRRAGASFFLPVVDRQAAGGDILRDEPSGLLVILRQPLCS